MTDHFPACSRVILDEEGFFSNDARDPGGMTKYGISQKAYPKVSIMDLTREDALRLYRKDYWDRNRCGDMPQWAALLVFDCGVNQGVETAAGILQTVLGVMVDSKVGPKTLAALNAIPPHKIQNFIKVFQALRGVRYTRSKTFHVHGLGWLSRLVLISIKADRFSQAEIFPNSPQLPEGAEA